MSVQLLALECRLKHLAETTPDKFPTRGANYWTRYSALLDFLRTRVYPHINAGLAYLSKSPGIYTDHGPDHFDEVVRYAGEIIEPSFEKNGIGAIDPYDLFLLLSAIRLHDAGNIDGREHHQRRAFSILKEAGSAVCPDDDEVSLISSIAEAHGGETPGGDRDTIGALKERSGMGIVKCRPQMIAALVRFADEICEHSCRASAHHLAAGTLPPQNQLFQQYAMGVKQASVDPDAKSFELRLVFDAAILTCLYPTPKHRLDLPDEKYVLDDAFDRIEKLDTERNYCNRFLDPQLRTERLEVQLDITQTKTAGGQSIKQNLISKIFTIQERGYPPPNTSWRSEVRGMSGSEIASIILQQAAS